MFLGYLILIQEDEIRFQSLCLLLAREGPLTGVHSRPSNKTPKKLCKHIPKNVSKLLSGARLHAVDKFYLKKTWKKRILLWQKFPAMDSKRISKPLDLK